MKLKSNNVRRQHTERILSTIVITSTFDGAPGSYVNEDGSWIRDWKDLTMEVRA